MADSVVQETLGSEFHSLYKSVKEVVNGKNKMLRSVFEDLKLTLDSLQPLVREKVQSDLLSCDVDIFRTMQNGVALVRKSSNRSIWSAYKVFRYRRKLIALEKSLQNLVDILRIQELKNVGNTWNSVNNREKSSKEKSLWDTKPEVPSFTVGMSEPLRDVKMNLLSEDTSMLVLTGPGGCGKTTLAAAICRDADIKVKFRDNIFFITMGKRPHMSLQEIYQLIGCQQIPDLEGEVSAKRWLHFYLQERSLLLIFDDCWPESESLLENFIPDKGKEMPNYKILMTSRFEFTRLGSSYHLNVLNEEDSMTLFRHSAFLGDKTFYVPLDLSKEIVKNCKGLPLAILVVGKSLCGKPIEIWRNTVMQWSKGYSVLDSDNGLLFTLQSSLNDLGKENYILRESFIDLASFPEDHAIAVPALTDIWAQLYGLHDDMECMVNLYGLTTRSLANVVVRRKVEDDYSEHIVTQHDILRSLAIYQTRHDQDLSRRLNIDIRGDNDPEWSTEHTQKPKTTRLLSISTDEMFSTNWPIMQLPKPEVLILNFRTTNYLLPKFIRDMQRSLKVLIVIHYGSETAELGDFHLLSSLSNLKTIRLHRISIPCDTKKPIHLKNIQKISFLMCDLSCAFGKDTAILISRAFPVLVEINIDYCRDLVELQDDICNLAHLKKLSITNCHKLSVLPREIGKLLKLEMLRLRACTDLEELPGSIGNLKKLNYLDISHCFSIRELPKEMGELSSLRKMNMRECSRVAELPESLLNLVGLEEVICDQGAQDLWELFLPELRCTKITVVKATFNLDWLQKLQL